MSSLLQRLRAIFRRPQPAPLQITEEAEPGLSADRLDLALQRLRAQTPPPTETDDDGPI